MEALQKDLPQLIVGLDSADESANYIHILDIKENADYYCPCCKGSIKPRAYKKDEKYKVQPHFYHESGGCSEESYVHYICKTWLFERGCQFKVNGINYTVANIETEKILNTKFGKYKPDIIVHTDQDKTFFFEIKYTNKKCDLYAPRWDELGIDVVEVDAREFVNNKHEEKIPEFRLIYSDGECFIKSYSRTDYEETIAIRKLEWKRQDKLNYKIQWERLDWFWSILQDYKTDATKLPYVIDAFRHMENTDKIWCYLNISNKSCIALKDEFKNELFLLFRQQIEDILKDYSFKCGYKYDLTQISPLIYKLTIYIYVPYKCYVCKESISLKMRTSKGILLPENLEDIDQKAKRLYNLSKKIMNNINRISTLEKLDYIEEINPCSLTAANSFNFYDLHFRIKFQDYIYNRYIKQEIGKCLILPDNITLNNLNSKYLYYSTKCHDQLENLYITHALRNNSLYMNTLDKMQNECFDKHLDLKISEDYRRIYIMYNDTQIFYNEFSENDHLDNIGIKLYERFIKSLENLYAMTKIIDSLMIQISNCKNKLWNAKYKKSCFKIKLSFCENTASYVTLNSTFDNIENYKSYVKTTLHKKMVELSNGEYYDYRLMEVR